MLSSEGQKELLQLLQKVPNELSQFINNYLNDQTIPNFARSALNASLDKYDCKEISFLSKHILSSVVNNLLKTDNLSNEVKTHLLTLI